MKSLAWVAFTGFWLGAAAILIVLGYPFGSSVMGFNAGIGVCCLVVSVSERKLDPDVKPMAKRVRK